MRRILAAIIELTEAMAEDWCIEYPRYIAGELGDDPHAFLSLATMRHKMVNMGTDSEMLLQTVALVDKKFADAQYKKLLKARDIVMVHDAHFKGASEKYQAESEKRKQSVEH